MGINILTNKMPKGKATKGKSKVVSAAGTGKSSGSTGSLFKKTERNFRIGSDIQPTKNLTRFVKWPKYVRIQRQKRVLMMRLKVPAPLHIFSQCLDRSQTSFLMKILSKYAPETRAQKKERLQIEAEARKGGDKSDHIGPKPCHIKYGMNHVTTLVEEGKAKLVIMTNDVEPIEMMAFLPALCRSKGVPFCFVKGKHNLGKLVHMKTATCLAMTEVRKEDANDFSNLQKQYMNQYNDNINHLKNAGGGIMGIKNQHMMRKREKIREIEDQKKANIV